MLTSLLGKIKILQQDSLELSQGSALRGFTLFELIIVIAIIGTLSGFILPRLQIPTEHGSNVLNEIQVIVEKWRNKSLKDNKDYWVELNGEDFTLTLMETPQQNQNGQSRDISHPSSNSNQTLDGDEAEVLLAEEELFPLVYEMKAEDTFYTTASYGQDGQKVYTLKLSPNGRIEPLWIYRDRKDDLALHFSGTTAPARIRTLSEFDSFNSAEIIY